MVTKVADWLNERLGWRAVWTAVFARQAPKVNWFYTLGSATLFVGVLQIVTGILLTMYYVPTPDHAYDSVTYITTQVPFGWLIRGLHHWGASAMLVLCVLHLLRTFLFGAYKYPREITWLTGVALLIIVIGFGFTGYLLPWDQKAYFATTVGTEIVSVVPGIGSYLLRIARGGQDISALTLTRFFGGHIWVLPAALAMFMGVHIYLVIRNGISAPPQKDE
jgi:quinol-cytochrome oxidoreductase complex cytochrome b subunit